MTADCLAYAKTFFKPIELAVLIVRCIITSQVCNYTRTSANYQLERSFFFLVRSSLVSGFFERLVASNNLALIFRLFCHLLIH